MIIIATNIYGHDWQKQNLVTIFSRGKNYDILKCSKCGIEGKTTALGFISLKEIYKNKIYDCTGQKITKIKITLCTASGALFSNLFPESEHNVIPAPAPYKDDNRGVWVMGDGEPVKVLHGEFINIS